MIEIRDLYKYYGDRRALGPVTAEIAKGEIIGLLGLNGAGKTTTLRILACDLLPTSGTVRVSGHDVVSAPEEVRARVGYLPDRPPLYDDMTVREYLAFAARLRRVPRTDVSRRVDEVVEQTELGDVMHQMIGTLSHGFRQRVGIAQAIVHRPAFVVLDEPISGLDPVQIVEMRELVRGLRGAHTVIVSSHILTEISETCDRIFVIDEGRIAWAGTEKELSSEFGQGMRIDVTVRGGAEERVLEALRAVDGVQSAELAPPSEPGEDVRTLRVSARGDVRDAVCRALVGADVSVLELVRRRELESMVLALLGGGESGTRRRAKRRFDERREAPAEQAAAEVPQAEGV
ncbi:MAG TPA: ABC transporter ATP-binding protein [Polyangiaceae bacterium]|nr:ABC transporter ATP-binding protein [Polyangiaceae bacterium]